MLSAAETCLQNIVFQHAIQQQSRLTAERKRIVHYTNAEVAFSIIQNKQVWMRNAIVMNDYSEISHGEACLGTAWASDAGKRLQNQLDKAFPGFVEDLANTHNRSQNLIRSNTYLTCVSEHEDHEDVTGRLSMWRAYGGDNGVALVIDNSTLFGSENSAKAYSSPVLYASLNNFVCHFGQIVDEIEQHYNVMQNCSRSAVMDILIRAFRFAVLSTKHPGFREEAEWRIIYTPSVEQSTIITQVTKVINGVPQIVCLLTLGDLSKLNRVIIGPTKFPKTIYDGFFYLLEKAGVSDPSTKIFISDIPLRR